MADSSPLDLAPVDVDDAAALRAWAEAATTTYLAATPTDAEMEARRRRFAGQRLTAGRTADGRTVATFRSFDTHLDVPGGRVPANGVTSVSVLPTHRRRGLLTRWITEDLARAARGGAPVSILIASEAEIYGRYGFGTAARSCSWTLDAATARFTAPVTGTVLLSDPQEWAVEAAAVYERARQRQPGAIDRRPLWWEVTAGVADGGGEPDRRQRLALRRDAFGLVDGALRWTVEEHYDDRVPASTLVVSDLVTATDDAAADLWRFCAEIDLVTSVRAGDRGPGDVLPHLLTEPRPARSGPVADFLWVRLHDAVAALEARRYPVAGTLVLDVADGALGAEDSGVAGRYRLEVADDGTARATSSDDDPDLRLDATALAGVWLGGDSPGVLARAGRVVPRDDAALARATALFSWPDAAWCGTWF